MSSTVAATRRRGDALVAAIREAALEELAAVGYAGLSMERVAERARTGKASIYRRWPTKFELVVDALDHTLPRFDEPPDTGSVRGDLLAVLRVIARTMSTESGRAARACLAFVDQEPELGAAVRERLLPPRKAMVLEILRRGAERGEVRPEAVTMRVAEVGPMLLHGELLQRGAPIRDATVRAIVDEVLVPLIRL